MNRAAQIAFPALLLVIVGGLVGAGFLVLDYSWRVLAFPSLAALVVGVLCLVQIAALVSGRATLRAADESDLEPLTVSSVAWIFVLGVFLFAFGFVFGPAAYLLAYLRANGSSWRLSIIIAAASLLVTWGLFINFLRVLLPLEPLWWP